MRFYTGSSLPESYHQQILIAEHGSWNRRDKSGYRLTVVRVDDSGETSYEPFVEGWLQGKSAWGRPVDLLVLPDGSLLVSDDRQGVIYRLAYSGS
jgi:glucose/arabinose dehydrogenase